MTRPHTVEDNAAKAAAQNPLSNRLLAALPVDDYDGLVPHLEFVPLHLGQEIYGPGQTLDYAYFPTTAVVSLLYTMEDGTSAEIGIVGNDGILGIALFMGGDSVPNRAVVQSAGAAFRMRARVLASEFRRGGDFQRLLAEVHPVFDCSDVADGSLQPPSFRGAAALPLVTSQSRPPANQ